MKEGSRNTKWGKKVSNDFLKNIEPIIYCKKTGIKIHPFVEQLLPAIDIFFLPRRITGPNKTFNKSVVKICPFLPSDNYIKGNTKDLPQLLNALDNHKKSIILRVNLQRKRNDIEEEYSKLLTAIKKELKENQIRWNAINDRDFDL